MKYFHIPLIFFFILISGCVERRIDIESSPPGAVVLLDGQVIGNTPVSTSFLFYGVREVTLYKEGYEILSNMENVSPPFYAVFPLDVFTDLLLPIKFKDPHKFLYTLKPYPTFTAAQQSHFLERANSLRKEKSSLTKESK